MTPAASESIENYHRWYYDSRVWEQITYRGVPILKWVGDLWNYQEIIYRLRPRLVVEFGSWNGGSALYFADLLQRIDANGKVLAVDSDFSRLHESSKSHPYIEWMQASTSEPAVASRIQELRKTMLGPVFFVIDSNHRKPHVLAELENIRPVTVPGDYVIVEDGNINGHPVLPGWGDGPYEAIAEYFSRHADDYEHDERQESKFGFSFAPQGYLIRKGARI
jgi:cephalosporin hydroxylase